jgi:hypothetical protein
MKRFRTRVRGNWCKQQSKVSQRTRSKVSQRTRGMGNQRTRGMGNQRTRGMSLAESDARLTLSFSPGMICPP